MSPKEAIGSLKPEKWRTVSAPDRLQMLKEIRTGLAKNMERLSRMDRSMKNSHLGEPLVSEGQSVAGTVLPIGLLLSALIDLYEFLAKGKMPEVAACARAGEGLYDLKVFPWTFKERLLYSDQRGYLRVKGEPEQIDPLKKEGGIIGVLGAGNYSSSVESLMALFLENCAVVHKPHELNVETDKIWEEIFKPLVKIGALAFCDSDQGRELAADPRLKMIYFTGGTATARAIMKATSTPLVSECGGNNPVIMVPGDNPWSRKQLRHQALQIATLAKMNGGAVCGRGQTLVTSRNWPQRQEFLMELKRALGQGTPAAGSYYPGSKEVWDRFLEKHPGAEIIDPGQDARGTEGRFMFIEDADKDSFSTGNEAFCQIMSEVSLETAATVEEFLPAAVDFCNDKLLGTLAAMLVVDDEAMRNHRSSLERAVTDLEYGAVGVNSIPPLIWLNPYLTWGGNEEGKELVSGRGNFGNALCFQNVEKSILYSDFMSLTHILDSNKLATDHLYERMAEYALRPSWARAISLGLAGLRAQRMY